MSMSAKAQQDRTVVALAAVACGRLSHAASVRAGRGQCCASADQYRVQVTEPGAPASAMSNGHGAPSPNVVLEHWGGDAQLLELRSSLTGSAGRSAPRERAQIAARTLTYYDLDSLQIVYPDGSELSASRAEILLVGPRRGRLHRRQRLLRAAPSDLV